MNAEQLARIKEENDLYVVQDMHELLWLANVVEKLRPKVVLEIGVECGGTLKYWEQLSDEHALILGIDIADPVQVTWDMTKSSREIHYVQGDSHDPETVGEVSGILDGREIDFMFIDGDHTYEGVKADWDNYSKFVRGMGVIAFHDVGSNNPPRVFLDALAGVEKLICFYTIGIGYVVKGK